MYCSTSHPSPSGASADEHRVRGGCFVSTMSSFWLEVCCRAGCPSSAFQFWLGGLFLDLQLLSCPPLTGSCSFPQCWVTCPVLQSPDCYSFIASCSTDWSEGTRYFSWMPRVLREGMSRMTTEARMGKWSGQDLTSTDACLPTMSSRVLPSFSIPHNYSFRQQGTNWG